MQVLFMMVGLVLAATLLHICKPMVIMRVIYVVQASVYHQEELAALQSKGLEESSYAYITSMAVSSGWRRRGIASALLGAAERIAGKWWQNWVLLHVYNSDAAGESLAPQIFPMSSSSMLVCCALRMITIVVTAVYLMQASR